MLASVKGPGAPELPSQPVMEISVKTDCSTDSATADEAWQQGQSSGGWPEMHHYFNYTPIVMIAPPDISRDRDQSRQDPQPDQMEVEIQ